MRFNSILDVLGVIAITGMVTTVVASPRSAEIIRNLGQAFAGSLAAAQGRGGQY